MFPTREAAFRYLRARVRQSPRSQPLSNLQLTDFGLAKAGMGDGVRSNSKVGTVDYMPPEIIKGQGHGPEADWWSLGYAGLGVLGWGDR